VVALQRGTEEDFIAASLANAVCSVLEPDNLRFDILRNAEDPTKFVLVEVYASPDGPVAWADTRPLLGST
jgi:quinol monooxygenase YgiN